MLKERQSSSINKIISDLKKTYEKAIEETKKSYEEALSLAPSNNLKIEIKKLKNKDVDYILESLEKDVENCHSFVSSLHKKEIELLSKKIKTREREIEEAINEIEESYVSRFDSLKKEILEKIESSFKEKAENKGEMGTENGDYIEQLPSSNVEMIKKDLESLGDANWLHYLGKANRRIFWKYVRGEMNKEKAIKKAKELYIKEKIKSLSLNEEEAEELMKLI